MAATDRRVGGVDDAVDRLDADLFDLTILGRQLKAAVDTWRDTHMDPGERVKAVRARQLAEQTHAVTVALPDGPSASWSPVIQLPLEPAPAGIPAVEQDRSHHIPQRRQGYNFEANRSQDPDHLLHPVGGQRQTSEPSGN